MNIEIAAYALKYTLRSLRIKTSRMFLLKEVGHKLDEKFPKFFNGAGKSVAPPKELAKRVLFSCHMYGQCILHSTFLLYR